MDNFCDQLLKIEVELSRSLDHFKVPEREKDEVLGAFRAQKNDVTAGATSAARR
jgi:hypothetical protein